MKYLLVLAVVLIGFYVWRSSREGRKPPAAPRSDKPSSAAPSIEIVQCARCGIHCPSTDAIAGKLGVYCTAQHRREAEP
jgi:uncharacterized protein